MALINKFLGFNEAAWEKFDELDGTEVDRALLSSTLDKINESYTNVIAQQRQVQDKIENL